MGTYSFSVERGRANASPFDVDSGADWYHATRSCGRRSESDEVRTNTGERSEAQSANATTEGSGAQGSAR